MYSQSGSKAQFDTPLWFTVVESTALLSRESLDDEVEAWTEVKVCVELLLAMVTSAFSLVLLLPGCELRLMFVLVLDGVPGYSGGGTPNSSIIRR